MADLKDHQTTDKHPAVRFLSNGLLDVSRQDDEYCNMALENQRLSPFLKLPPELRTLIYEFTFGGETFIIADPGQMTQYDERKENMYLALTLVSRQIYAEAVLVPFKVNLFQGSSPGSLQKWGVRRLPIAAKQNINRFRLSITMLWHTYMMSAGEIGTPLSELRRQSGDFSDLVDFPAIRNITIHTELALCVCFKAKAQRDKLFRFLDDSQSAIEELVKATYNGAAGRDIRVFFERDFDFNAGYGDALSVDDEEGP